MESIVLYIITLFFILGAIDYLLGNKFSIGEEFENGIKTMGPLAISMVGILSITPLLSSIIEIVISPIAKNFNIDPSIFSSSFIAIDMGGYNIASNIANSSEFVIFSGILMASILGCTLSFTLPLALGLVKEKYMDSLTKGFLCGIITVPIGLFIGGLALKIDLRSLFINLFPIILLSVILSIGIIFKPKLCIFIFNFIGKVIVCISVLGLVIQGIYSIIGIKIVENIMPLQDTLCIVGKISIFLGGAYVMLKFIKKIFGKQFNKLERIFGVNSNTLSAFIGSFASAIIVFDNFHKLDEKGRVICSAFSVSGAYVLGGQLGYVASVEKEYMILYIFVKILSGILAIIFALFILRREDKNRKVINTEEAS